MRCGARAFGVVLGEMTTVHEWPRGRLPRPRPVRGDSVEKTRDPHRSVDTGWCDQGRGVEIPITHGLTVDVSVRESAVRDCDRVEQTGRGRSIVGAVEDEAADADSERFWCDLVRRIGFDGVQPGADQGFQPDVQTMVFGHYGRSVGPSGGRPGRASRFARSHVHCARATEGGLSARQAASSRR